MGNGRAFKKHAQGKESEIGIYIEREGYGEEMGEERGRGEIDR